jgi:hypothetical protein
MVQRALDQAGGSLGWCYHDARLRGEDVRRADFVVHLQVEPAGRVRAAELRAAALPERRELADCVLGVLRELPVAPFEGPPVAVDVPVRAPR